MTRRRRDVFTFAGRLVREFVNLCFALERFSRRRARTPFTPEQEAAYLVGRLHREQDAERRYGPR